MQIEQHLANLASQPKTHFVVKTYRDGRVHRFGAHSEAAANNHAIGERRKIGRKLIDRGTGVTVEVISVCVELPA